MVGGAGATLRGVSILFLHGNDSQAVTQRRDEALAGTDVQHVDLAATGVRGLVAAGSTPGMFTPSGVYATGGETIRVADEQTLIEAAATPAPIVIHSTKAPGPWMVKRLSEQVTVVDCSVPKGGALNAYIAQRAREVGVTLSEESRSVIAQACGPDAGRIRSALWVCVTCTVTRPTPDQLRRILAGWHSETSAWLLVDKALNGDVAGALNDAEHAPAAVIAHALRGAANRLRNHELGQDVSGSQSSRSAVLRAAKRGVRSTSLARGAVAIDDALRSAADENSVCAIQLARIAATTTDR